MSNANSTNWFLILPTCSEFQKFPLLPLMAALFLTVHLGGLILSIAFDPDNIGPSISATGRIPGAQILVAAFVSFAIVIYISGFCFINVFLRLTIGLGCVLLILVFTFNPVPIPIQKFKNSDSNKAVLPPKIPAEQKAHVGIAFSLFTFMLAACWFIFIFYSLPTPYWLDSLLLSIAQSLLYIVMMATARSWPAATSTIEHLYLAFFYAQALVVTDAEILVV